MRLSLHSLLGAPLLLLLVFMALGCSPSVNQERPTPDGGVTDDAPPQTVAFRSEERKALFRLSPLPSKPPGNPTNQFADNPKAAHLGQYLFFDKRLSSTGTLSCASCHSPDKGFGDGRARSRGLADLTRNAPPLWNLAFNRWYTWDGRADSLWMQALKPLEDPAEMGFNRLQPAHLLADNEPLRIAYEKIFGPLPKLSDKTRFPPRGGPIGDTDDPLRIAWDGMAASDQQTINVIFTNVTKSIEAYQRKLISRESPFDRFVADLKKGNVTQRTALSLAAQRGARVFVGKGRCVLCHAGTNFTDKEFHNLGLGLLPDQTTPDRGRFLGVLAVKRSQFNGLGPYSDGPNDPINDRVRFVKQNSNNLGEFKTPSLRSVALTAPYMHDGRFQTLKEVVDFYNELNTKPSIGHREESLKKLQLSSQEKEDLVAFLKSLTGSPLSPELLKQPPSPSP